ncbi:MAG: hypothetical protein IPK76_16680 [Lewinellaceae bacterium]|nr:hypothetical protein [Lewinellaceae bacterium]
MDLKPRALQLLPNPRQGQEAGRKRLLAFRGRPPTCADGPATAGNCGKKQIRCKESIKEMLILYARFAEPGKFIPLTHFQENSRFSTFALHPPCWPKRKPPNNPANGKPVRSQFSNPPECQRVPDNLLQLQTVSPLDPGHPLLG